MRRQWEQALGGLADAPLLRMSVHGLHNTSCLRRGWSLIWGAHYCRVWCNHLYKVAPRWYTLSLHTLFLFQSLDRNPWTLADTLDAHTARKTQIATYKPRLYSRNPFFKYSPRVLDRSTIQGVYLAIHWLIAHYPSHDPRSMTPAIRTWAFPGPYLSSYSSLTLAVTSSRDPMTPSALCGSWPGTAGTTQRFVRWRKQFQRMQNFERLFKMKKSASHFSSQMVYLLSHPYAQFLDVKDIYLIMEPFFNTQKGLVGKSVQYFKIVSLRRATSKAMKYWRPAISGHAYHRPNHCIASVGTHQLQYVIMQAIFAAWSLNHWIPTTQS